MEAIQGDGPITTLGQDDSSLNGIELSCLTPNTFSQMDTISSDPGYWGMWSAYAECPTDYWLVAFSLRVGAYLGPGNLEPSYNQAETVIIKL